MIKTALKASLVAFYVCVCKKRRPIEMASLHCNSIVAAKLGAPSALPGRAAQVGPRRSDQAGLIGDAKSKRATPAINGGSGLNFSFRSESRPTGKRLSEPAIPMATDKLFCWFSSSFNFSPFIF